MFSGHDTERTGVMQPSLRGECFICEGDNVLLLEGKENKR